MQSRSGSKAPDPIRLVQTSIGQLRSVGSRGYLIDRLHYGHTTIIFPAQAHVLGTLISSPLSYIDKAVSHLDNTLYESYRRLECFANERYSKLFVCIMHALQTLWLLPESDFVTWMISNTAFGFIAALAGPPS